MDSASEAPAAPADLGLLLCRDLFFVSKVTGTAAALGCRVEVVCDAASAETRLAQGGVRGVMIDLSLPIAAEDVADLVSVARRHGVASVLAFGSHVAQERLSAAAKAGCGDVYPKSRFAAQLPQILKRCLGPR
jgi:DNA-binding NtrC family response regulator